MKEITSNPTCVEKSRASFQSRAVMAVRGMMKVPPLLSEWMYLEQVQAVESDQAYCPIHSLAGSLSICSTASPI